MKQKQNHAIIVIDVFRAFTTAAYILDRLPTHYFLATKSNVISKLASSYPNSLLIGKPEKNENLKYDIPNSPTRTTEISVENKTILHRTEAGAKGILQALSNESSTVLAASLVNADATIQYIKAHNINQVSIWPMGHEATTPSLEDDICAMYIQASLNGKNFHIAEYLPAIREGAGQYFFTEDQWQYPEADFERCLKLDCFNFAIQATAGEDYAILTRCDM